MSEPQTNTAPPDQPPPKTRYLNHDYLTGAHDTLDWQADPDINHFFLQSPTGSVHWSIAWSDLMMTMFVLFMVMFIYKVNNRDFLARSTPDAPLASTILPPERSGPGGNSLARFYDLSKLTIDRNKLNEFAAIDLAPDKTVKIVMTGDLLFEAGNAAILPQAREALEKIAGLLQRTPYTITVTGHTDNQPIHSDTYPSNWELSAGRAGAVARFLIQKTQLPPGQFIISGRGEFQPAAANDTPEHRARNRRVEIIITNSPVQQP